MNLSEKHCVPCRGGVPALQGEELERLKQELPTWQVVDGHHLLKTFTFPDFKTALAFVNRAGEIVAWNEGDVESIFVEVDLDGGYRIFDGDDLIDVNWVQRRPHLYGAFVDPGNYGSLR